MEADDVKSYAGSVYGPLIDYQLAVERDLKTSLEQRGIVVITTAGTLVGLIFGFSVLVPNISVKFLSAPFVVTLLLAALGLFLVAALSAILTNTAWTYDEFATDELARLCKTEYWIFEDTVEAARSVAETKVEILDEMRRQNQRKAYALIAGFAAEAGAILFLALSVAQVLRP